MKRTALVVATIAVVAAPACVAETEGSSSVSPAPSPSSSKVAELELILEGKGRPLALLRTGVRDVKDIGLWRPLTRHLGIVKLEAYAEAYRVPPDRHLADAVFQLTDETGELQQRCDVVFYTVAMADQVRIWHREVAFGLRSRSPTLRQLYASTVAHELAHCRPGRHGEEVALRWERKAMRALRSR